MVICVPRPDGDWFALIETEAMIALTFPPRPGEAWSDAMRRYLHAQELLTEDGIRARLAAMGLDERAATERIFQARRQTALNAKGSWDHITTIGFRNREGQLVLRKTDRDGQSPGQRVFILQCTVCNHEYGCDGCDIYDRLCPKCQDVAAGLSTT